MRDYVLTNQENFQIVNELLQIQRQRQRQRERMSMKAKRNKTSMTNKYPFFHDNQQYCTLKFNVQQTKNSGKQHERNE